MKNNLFLVLTLIWSSLGQAKTVAILGDSLSSGAATHPALTFSTADLWKIFNGESDLKPQLLHVAKAQELGLEDLISPIKVWPSIREYEGGLGWVFKHTMMGLSRLYLNTEEYSWGYLAARSFGTEPKAIVIAAENGARTSAAPRQYDRVLDHFRGQRPDHLFLLFTGNDLCGPSIEFILDSGEYENTLKGALGYIERNGDTAPGGRTHVHVVGFLGIMQLLYSESILNQKVSAHGEMVTCRELRNRSYAPPVDVAANQPPDLGMFAMMMPPNPAAICPTLFAKKTEGDDIRATLANRIRAFRKKQKLLVEEFNRKLEDEGRRNVVFHYVEETTKIIFEGGDIAHDCFHLSATGQTKIALSILDYWKKI